MKFSATLLAAGLLAGSAFASPVSSNLRRGDDEWKKPKEYVSEYKSSGSEHPKSYASHTPHATPTKIEHHAKATPSSYNSEKGGSGKSGSDKSGSSSNSGSSSSGSGSGSGSGTSTTGTGVGVGGSSSGSGVSLSSPSPVASPLAVAGDSSIGIPGGLLTSDKGIAFGWLPDSGNGANMAKLNQATAKKAATYGWYSQITSSKYDDSQLTQVLDDVVASGAVFIPAVMPTKVKFSEIDAALAQQIAASMKKFTDKGVEVWLRFAHEVNYYVTDGTYVGGTSEEFVAAWKIVHDAVASNPKVKMFWSPNSASSSSIQPWFPGTQYVDMVGMDVYPKSGSSFSSVYGDFYNAFSAKTGLPFVIGETGSGSYDANSKEAWLKEVTNGDYSAYPNYKAGCWFEYYKGGDDFRVLQPATIKESMSNFNA